MYEYIFVTLRFLIYFLERIVTEVCLAQKEDRQNGRSDSLEAPTWFVCVYILQLPGKWEWLNVSAWRRSKDSQMT